MEFRSDGTKKILRPSHMSLARVSVLRGEGPKEGEPFIDDYIHTKETVVDYLTEFSGIKSGDLDPGSSVHTLVPLKVAYKKLRLLVDLGCIFIGHGLAKDFRTISTFPIRGRQRVLIHQTSSYHPLRSWTLSIFSLCLDDNASCHCDICRGTCSRKTFRARSTGTIPSKMRNTPCCCTNSICSIWRPVILTR